VTDGFGVWSDSLDLESLHSGCDLIELPYNVPAHQNNDQETDPVVVAVDSQITTGEVGGVLADHGPKERNRQVGVVPGSRPRDLHEIGVRSGSFLHGPDDSLLRRPNPEPYIECHDAAEHRPGVYEGSAIAENAIVHEQEDNDGHNDKAHGDRNFDV